jgi:membrane-associated phospholipid phosphatase
MSGPINPPHKAKSLALAGTSASPMNTADTLTLADARPQYPAYSPPTAPNRAALRAELGGEISQLNDMGDDLYAGVIRIEIQQAVNIAAVIASRTAWDPTLGIPAYTVSGTVGGSTFTYTTGTRSGADVYADAVVVKNGKGAVPAGNNSPWWKLVRAEDLGPVFPFIAALGLQTTSPANKVKRTGAVIDIVSGVALEVVLRLKNRMQVPRPSALTNNLTPLIDSPTHSSFPGGHAIIAHAVATVLKHLLGDSTAALSALADTAGSHRVQAGLHTAFDTSQGKSLGIAIGNFMINALAERGSPYVQWPALFAMASQDWE